MTFLQRIIRDKEAEITGSKQRFGKIGDLKRMFRNTPPMRSFYSAVKSGFGLIAEIKRESPSAGPMLQENITEAPAAYNRSRIVNAVSVLTNETHFGGCIDDLLRVKEQVHQPILRKDFIFQEYQVYESRALGADAILLMINVAQKKDDVRRLFEVACECELDVLFELHDPSEIEWVPSGAKICGINSRKFETTKSWLRFGFSRWLSQKEFWRGSSIELSTDFSAFGFVNDLPGDVKVAESGIKPSRVKDVRSSGFDSILVGTSLLKAPEGVTAALREFEVAISPPEPARSVVSQERQERLPIPA